MLIRYDAHLFNAKGRGRGNERNDIIEGFGRNANHTYATRTSLGRANVTGKRKRKETSER